MDLAIDERLRYWFLGFSNPMKDEACALLFCLILAGCCNGPTHDYYSPGLTGSVRKFKGPITLGLVQNVEIEKKRCLSEGYTLIGTSDYRGKYPEACELRAQAKRSHANRVVYSCRHAEGQEGFRFYIGRVAPWDPNPLAPQFDVRIVFLGR